MLQELLHPPPVSLVTPIPTPNTVGPFVFPPPPSVRQSLWNLLTGILRASGLDLLEKGGVEGCGLSDEMVA